MPARIFAGESDASFLYKIGMVGVDAGPYDTSGVAGVTKNVFTGTLKTERFYPAGSDGLCFFRQLALRVWRTGTFSVAIKVWVDDKRTQVYATDGSASDQLIVGTGAEHATVGTVEETRIEAGLRARGTSIQVELTVDSDDVSRVFLPETLEIHYLPLRAARRDTAKSARMDVLASVATPGTSLGAGWTIALGHPFHGVLASEPGLTQRGVSAGAGSWKIVLVGASLAAPGVSAGVGAGHVSGAGAGLAAPGVSAASALLGALGTGASTASAAVSASLGTTYLLTGAIASHYNAQPVTRGVAYVWR